MKRLMVLLIGLVGIVGIGNTATISSSTKTVSEADKVTLKSAGRQECNRVAKSANPAASWFGSIRYSLNSGGQPQLSGKCTYLSDTKATAIDCAITAPGAANCGSWPILI